MPAIVDKYRIGVRSPWMDKRVKLTDDDKVAIRLWRDTEGISQRSLARIFGVSRRTIQFVLDPEKLKQNVERREERGGTAQYYDRDKPRVYMREHRKHKAELLEQHAPMKKVGE